MIDDDILPFPELELETDVFQMSITVKKDYSKIKNIDKRKKEFIKDLKDFIDEFDSCSESREFLAYYDY